MTTPGDASLVKIHEVEALMSGSQRNTIR